MQRREGFQYIQDVPRDFVNCPEPTCGMRFGVETRGSGIRVCQNGHHWNRHGTIVGGPTYLGERVRVEMNLTRPRHGISTEYDITGRNAYRCLCGWTIPSDAVDDIVRSYGMNELMRLCDAHIAGADVGRPSSPEERVERDMQIQVRREIAQRTRSSFFSGWKFVQRASGDHILMQSADQTVMRCTCMEFMSPNSGARTIKDWRGHLSTYQQDGDIPGIMRRLNWETPEISEAALHGRREFAFDALEDGPVIRRS